MTSGYHAKWCLRKKKAQRVAADLNKAIVGSINGHPSRQYVVEDSKHRIGYDVVKYLRRQED